MGSHNKGIIAPVRRNISHVCLNLASLLATSFEQSPPIHLCLKYIFATCPTCVACVTGLALLMSNPLEDRVPYIPPPPPNCLMCVTCCYRTGCRYWVTLAASPWAGIGSHVQAKSTATIITCLNTVSLTYPNHLCHVRYRTGSHYWITPAASSWAGGRRRVWATTRPVRITYCLRTATPVCTAAYPWRASRRR
jgi:hypothetical protein